MFGVVSIRRRHLRADLLLLLAAVLWGTTFVAQIEGMDHLGAFGYNGVRFLLGGLVLLPLALRSATPTLPDGTPAASSRMSTLLSLTVPGLMLFGGASLQQVGLLYTTAGNAAFITGLYVILVPLLGLAFAQRAGRGVWLGAVLAAAGLYVLSVRTGLSLNVGDLLNLIGAFFWAFYVIAVARFVPHLHPLRLACGQSLLVGVLSLLVAFGFEDISFGAIGRSAIPLLWGGLLSVGVAFTVQVVAQKDAPPAHAAVIMSLEAFFGAISGIIWLHEPADLRTLAGCALMFAGMLAAQYEDVVDPKQGNDSGNESG